MDSIERAQHNLEKRAHEIEQHAHERADVIRKTIHDKPRWWKQVLFVAVLYGLYSFARNVSGSALSIDTAKRHAQDIVDAERWLHIFVEQDIQAFFLDNARWFIKLLNVWYGSAHFVVTIFALVWLYFNYHDRYFKYRNVIFGTTLCALIGYIIYPLAPPRLLPPEFAFEDTLKTIGGFLNFSNKTVEDVSNQYAAMPSLHVGWATWVSFALVPIMRHWWSKAFFAIYPLITILAIVATGNHYFLDVLGGWLVLAIGWIAAEAIERNQIYRRIKSGHLTSREDLKR